MASDTAPLRQWLRDQLDLSAGTAVDLGCGGGDDLRSLALAHPGMRFVGIDRSDWRAEDDVSSNVRFVQADLSRGVPLGDESVDGVLSVNLLECLPDQPAFIQECARVLRPGGQIVVAHYDWDTQTFDGTDRDLVRRLVHAFSDWKQGWMDAIDPWAGRRLRSLFAENGSFAGEIRAKTLISTSFEEGSYGRQQAVAFGGLVRRGLVSEEEYARFMREQQEAAAANAFMFTVTMFAFVGRKHPAPMDQPMSS